LIGLGTAMTLAFLALRFSNAYGDANHWAAQKSPLFTVFSFIHCVKYPPSLCYLLMTLGPAMLALAALDLGTPRWLRPLLVFGRVPLFYYLLHLPLLHGMAVIANRVYHGRAEWLYGVQPPGPESAWGERGFGLLAVYAFWLLAVALLYPVCNWFAELKRRSRAAWLTYL